MELHAIRHKSKTVLAIGFEGDARGKLHVQFHDGQGNATARGHYLDVPRSIYNALTDHRSPGSFLNSHLKNKFEWMGEGGKAEISAAEKEEILQGKAKDTPTKKRRAESPHDRVAEFLERRREDAGEFVKTTALPDGYTLVEFQRASFYTCSDHRVSRAVYRAGIDYQRPALKREVTR